MTLPPDLPDFDQYDDELSVRDWLTVIGIIIVSFVIFVAVIGSAVGLLIWKVMF